MLFKSQHIIVLLAVMLVNSLILEVTSCYADRYSDEEEYARCTALSYTNKVHNEPNINCNADVFHKHGKGKKKGAVAAISLLDGKHSITYKKCSNTDCSNNSTEIIDISNSTVIADAVVDGDGECGNSNEFKELAARSVDQNASCSNGDDGKCKAPHDINCYDSSIKFSKSSNHGLLASIVEIEKKDLVDFVPEKYAESIIEYYGMLGDGPEGESKEELAEYKLLCAYLRNFADRNIDKREKSQWEKLGGAAMTVMSMIYDPKGTLMAMTVGIVFRARNDKDYYFVGCVPYHIQKAPPPFYKIIVENFFAYTIPAKEESSFESPTIGVQLKSDEVYLKVDDVVQKNFCSDKDNGYIACVHTHDPEHVCVYENKDKDEDKEISKSTFEDMMSQSDSIGGLLDKLVGCSKRPGILSSKQYEIKLEPTIACISSTAHVNDSGEKKFKENNYKVRYDYGQGRCPSGYKPYVAASVALVDKDAGSTVESSLYSVYPDDTDQLQSVESIAEYYERDTVSNEGTNRSYVLDNGVLVLGRDVQNAKQYSDIKGNESFPVAVSIQSINFTQGSYVHVYSVADRCIFTPGSCDNDKCGDPVMMPPTVINDFRDRRYCYRPGDDGLTYNDLDGTDENGEPVIEMRDPDMVEGGWPEYMCRFSDEVGASIVCPGIYNVTGKEKLPHKICLYSTEGWDFIGDGGDSGIFGRDGFICSSLPMTCGKLDQPERWNGFAVWHGDNKSVKQKFNDANMKIERFSDQVNYDDYYISGEKSILGKCQSGTEPINRVDLSQFSGYDDVASAVKEMVRIAYKYRIQVTSDYLRNGSYATEDSVGELDSASITSNASTINAYSSEIEISPGVPPAADCGGGVLTNFSSDALCVYPAPEIIEEEGESGGD